MDNMTARSASSATVYLVSLDDQRTVKEHLTLIEESRRHGR